MFSKVVFVMCIVGIAVAQENFQDCLQKDSISCVQLSVRKHPKKLQNCDKKNFSCESQDKSGEIYSYINWV